MKRLARRLLRRFDLNVVRFSPPAGRRLRVMELAGVGAVLDVGANTGQYGELLRDSGFDGRIVSFEPQRDRFEELRRLAAGDPSWECIHVALGDVDREADLHIGPISEMSSLRRPRHDLDSGRTEAVRVRRLDSIAADVVRPAESYLLKIDTEGSELEVLRGAEGVLEAVAVVEAELLLVGLYEAQPPMLEIVEHLRSRGFELADLLPGYFHWETGRLLHADGIFVRTPR